MSKLILCLLFVSILIPQAAHTQCPEFTNSEMTGNCTSGSTDCDVCPGDVLTLTAEGNDLPDGGCVNWYYSTINGFNPYTGAGTLIDCGDVMTPGSDPCSICPEFFTILIDACGTEADNEFIVFSAGSGFNTNNFQLDYAPQNNIGGGNNADVQIGSPNCGLTTPPTSLITGSGCDNVFAAGPGTNIPAGALVVFFTSSNASYNYDFGPVCGSGAKIYVMQSACARVTGGFSNSTSTGPRSTTLSLSNCGCSETVTYDTDDASLSGQGDHINNGSVGNDGCGAPDPGYVPPPPAESTIDDVEFTITSDLCNGGPYYIVGIVDPLQDGFDEIFTDYFEFNVVCSTPELGEATICRTDGIFDLNDIADPNFPDGEWSGQGVSGTDFDPTGLSGEITVTFSATSTCSLGDAMTTITVETGGIPDLGEATICVTQNPFDLTTLQDPLFPSGIWNGDGVNGTDFDPTGLDGTNSLSFTPDTDCAEEAFTTIIVETAIVPDLQSTSICNTSDPFDLINLADPLYPDGDWTGQGVNNNFFDPDGLSGDITLTFEPIGNCLETTTTTINVTSSVTPDLGTATLCEGDDPLDLSELEDPVYNEGEWSGPGVDNGYFDPTGLFDEVLVTFTPDDPCAEETTTSIFISPTSTPNSSDGVACYNDSVFALINLQDNQFVGMWEGDNVMNDTVDLNGLSGEIDYVFIPDGGCAETDTATLTVIPVGAVTFEINPTLCFGQSIVVDGTTYSETNPSGTSILEGQSASGCDSVVHVDLSFSNVSIYSYVDNVCPGFEITLNSILYNQANPTGSDTLIMGSAAGCDSIITVDLTYGAGSTLDIIEDMCPGEFIEVNGNIYNELNPTDQITIPNASGCDSIININLNYGQTGNLVDDRIMCRGDFAIYNGITYDINNTQGNDTLFGMSATGCDSIILVDLNYQLSDTNYLTRNLCFGQSIMVGNATYDETNTSGTEILPGASAFGCDSVVVVDLAFSNAAIYDVSMDLCQGESITINNTLYDILHPTGSDTLIQGSVSGCDSIINVSINFNLDSYYDYMETLCPDDFVEIGGIRFDQSNPIGVATLENENQFGCDSFVNVQLLYHQSDTNFINQGLCFGQTLLVNGTEYSETNTSGMELIPNGSTTGCDSIIIVALNYSNAATEEIIEFKCPGETIIVNGTTYDENNPTGQEMIPNGGQSGCDSVINIALTYVDPIYNYSRSFCEGESIMINGTTYDENNPTGQEVLLNGSVAGCDSIINIDFTFDGLEADFVIDQPDCEGNSDLFLTLQSVTGGSGLYGWTLDDNDVLAIIEDFPVLVGPLNPGPHTLHILDTSDCNRDIDFTIDATSTTILDPGPDITINNDDTHQINVITNFDPISIVWDPAISLSCNDCLNPIANPLATTTYTITAIDSAGCEITDFIRITVETKVDVYIPNVFSPNDDGVNDVLYIHSGPTITSVKDFQIFNRWGAPVFTMSNFNPNDKQFGWDGTFDGQKLDPAVFIYFAIIELSDGTTTLLEGDLTLIR